MTEVLVVTLSNLKYFFLKIIDWSFISLAVVFMTLLPMLKLMVPATIESNIALAALKKCLFPTNLACWRSIDGSWWLAHLLMQQIQITITIFKIKELLQRFRVKISFAYQPLVCLFNQK